MFKESLAQLCFATKSTFVTALFIMSLNEIVRADKGRNYERLSVILSIEFCLLVSDLLSGLDENNLSVRHLTVCRAYMRKVMIDKGSPFSELI